jgi:hypothetical protein
MMKDLELPKCTFYDTFTENEILMKLHVVVEKDEPGYYVAEVPALPGAVFLREKPVKKRSQT